MLFFIIFFFNDPATTLIYTLSLHDALPISVVAHARQHGGGILRAPATAREQVEHFAPRAGLGCALLWLLVQSEAELDRKSTRLNSSHVEISYAVFCLKKKKNIVLINIIKFC